MNQKTETAKIERVVILGGAIDVLLPPGAGLDVRGCAMCAGAVRTVTVEDAIARLQTARSTGDAGAQAWLHAALAAAGVAITESPHGIAWSVAASRA